MKNTETTGAPVATFGRYELSCLAAYRARSLYAGTHPLVDNSVGNRPVVVALKEIAAGAIAMETIREELIQSALRETSSILNEFESMSGSASDSLKTIETELLMFDKVLDTPIGEEAQMAEIKAEEAEQIEEPSLV